MRRVVFREEREEERYVIRSITLDFRTKFQYLLTGLTKDGSLRSSDQKALKHTVSHFLINCIVL